MMKIKGYQYALQKRRLPDGEWEFCSSNKHNEHVPYPTSYGPKIKQAREQRWDSYFDWTAEYRVLKRPYGDWEVVN
jgi:hypothetical protein